jgi:hypothetical protein
MSNVTLGWASGAGAQIEIFSPSAVSANDYSVKYTPAFRSPIRPPMEQLHLGSGELDPLNTRLNEVVQIAEGARGPAGSPVTPAGAVNQQLELAGNMLFELIVPRDVGADLRKPGLFLDIGVDDGLVQFPWELMHDGEDYIALKHYVGRYVNSNMPTATPSNGFSTLNSEKLKVLLVCVANPQPRSGGVPIPPLPGAETETQKLVDLFTTLPGVEVTLLKNQNATFTSVFTALRNGCHIFHFTGHAYFDEKFPYKSSLMVWDQDMSTGPLGKFIGKNVPVLCFINGCESAHDKAWEKSYNMFSLARTFLSTGSYLLGSRWKLDDAEAADFAVEFYTAFLQQRKSIGEATLAARRKLKDNGSPNSFAWASYVLYADPRICFKDS